MRYITQNDFYFAATAQSVRFDIDVSAYREANGRTSLNDCFGGCPVLAPMPTNHVKRRSTCATALSALARQIRTMGSACLRWHEVGNFKVG